MVLQALTDILVAKQLMIATAESCTAGLAAKLLTDQAGSSRWFERGFITYSDDAKQEMLGVREVALSMHGSVSEATVVEMAAGALRHSHANISLAISGIAGPGSDMFKQPVGTVWFAWADRLGRYQQDVQYFVGDRDAVRRQAADYAIKGMLVFFTRWVGFVNYFLRCGMPVIEFVNLWFTSCRSDRHWQGMFGTGWQRRASSIHLYR